MLDTALFILEGVLLKEKARPTYEGDAFNRYRDQ